MFGKKKKKILSAETDQERIERIAAKLLAREMREYNAGVHPSQMHPNYQHGVILNPEDFENFNPKSKERK